MTNGHRVGSPDNIWTRIEGFRHCVKRIQSIQRGSTWWEVQGSRVQSVSHAHFFFTKGVGIDFVQHVDGLTCNVFQSHLDLSKLLETSWKMGNYQKKIPQSDVWFYFPILFKVGTLIINKTHLGLLLAHVHTPHRPATPDKGGGSNLVIFSFYSHMCIDDDSLEMRYGQFDCVIWAGYISVCAIH